MHERTEKNPFGAGRPFKEGGRKQYKTISVVGLPSEIERLQKKAKENDKSTSRFIIESLNCSEEQNK